MKIDWTINMGTVLTAGVLLVGFVTAHKQNIRKLQDIETKVKIMFEWFQHSIVNRRGV